MADSSAPKHSSPGSGNSSSMPSPDWCVEQWSVLCDLLDVSDPREVVPRVRRLAEGPGSSSASSESSEVEQAFQEMQSQLQALQERNEDLMEHLQSEAAEESSQAEAHSSDAAALLDHLDVSSMSEARNRVESLTDQLEHLYREKEQLAEAGLMSADDVLDEVDRLQKKCDRLEQQGAPSPSPSSPASEAAAATVLDVDDHEAAESVATLAEETHDLLDQAVHALDLDMPSLADDPTTFPDTMRSLRDHATALLSKTSTASANAEIADILGLDTPDDARELEQIVKTMNEKLETLHSKQETLKEELGVSTTADILEMVQSMETQLSSFYAQQEEAHAFADEVEDVLGISSAEEAHDLAAIVHDMSTRLEDLASTHDSLAEAGYDPDSVLDTITNMEEQLVALYAERDEDSTEADVPDQADLIDAVTHTLGLTTPEEVEQMDASVRQMSNRLDTLQTEHDILAEANLTAEDAVDMIDNMNDQLSSLYEARDKRTERLSHQLEQLGAVFGFPPPDAGSPETALNDLTDAAESLLNTASHPLPDSETPDNLAAAVQILIAKTATASNGDAGASDELEAIKERLGISTVEEADELATMTRNMSEQLEAYRSDYELLEEAGVTSVKSAVDMIDSLSAQLDELYKEQEGVRAQSGPMPEQQDTFEQLASLYSEQEKLERALGVSDADAVIEMVEALTAQLDDLYSDREAASAGPPDLDSPSFQPDPSTNGTGTAAPVPDEDADTLHDQMIISLQDQLEVLYTEKEALLEIGLANAQEAVEHIDELESQIDTLEHEREQCYDRLERLEEHLGTANVSDIVEMVDTPAASSPEAGSPPTAAPESAPPSPSSSLPKEAPVSDSGPSLLPDDMLHQIDDLDEATLDDLSVGALRLDDDGRIEYLNEAACQLPGLDDVDSRSELLGEVLFEIVPSTSNTLFLNRFRNGVEQGRMDARFSYTFVSPRQSPRAFFVHLYRAASSGTNWLLFEPAE